MVTSKKLLLLFLIHGFPLLKRSDFLACFIMEMSRLDIFRSTRVSIEKHPRTIKGQLFEEFNQKSGKRTETHEMESSFLSKR